MPAGLNGDWHFLTDLFTKSRERADDWPRANFDCIGVESTVNLEGQYF